MIVLQLAPVKGKTMSSREKILRKLRAGNRPFPEISKPESYRAMVSIEDTSLSALLSKFIDEAQKASCVIHQARTREEAIKTVLNLLEGEKTISSWHLEHIPIPGISETFENADITCVGEYENVRVGLTGVDAALAATGSIVLLSGSEKIRNQLYILNRRPIGLWFFLLNGDKNVGLLRSVLDYDDADVIHLCI